MNYKWVGTPCVSFVGESDTHRTDKSTRDPPVGGSKSVYLGIPYVFDFGLHTLITFSCFISDIDRSKKSKKLDNRYLNQSNKSADCTKNIILMPKISST